MPGGGLGWGGQGATRQPGGHTWDTRLPGLRSQTTAQLDGECRGGPRAPSVSSGSSACLGAERCSPPSPCCLPCGHPGDWALWSDDTCQGSLCWRMQVTSSSDWVLALFPGQGMPGQNWGCAGQGEKQWDLGQDCTRDPTSTRGWAGPGTWGPRG